MLKTRQHNVTSATWSPNGEALGTTDLTDASNNPFGLNVFSTAVQRERLPKDVFEKLQSTLAGGEALEHAAPGRGHGVGPPAGSAAAWARACGGGGEKSMAFWRMLADAG